jgi:tRNA (mo5U34)-methyltransferase
MEIIDSAHLQHLLQEHGLAEWGDDLTDIISRHLENHQHGDFKKWQTAIQSLPDIKPQHVDFSSEVVSIQSEISKDTRNQIQTALQLLHPWRKGPFSIHGVHIDTEWRSDMKWKRLVDHIKPLRDKRILDIGCGNGYYLWRMLGEGARCAIGIDPTQLFTMQFRAIQHFAGEHLPISVLPIGIEHLPEGKRTFDTVFSMGVIYHRRDPLEHINQLRTLLHPGGELILETLIVQQDDAVTLQPQDRYAQMRNVWNIPSPARLLEWFNDCGLRDARIVDITTTTSEEQRSTAWMRFHSLTDFLDPQDPGMTVEGYPAPVRAIAIARV